MISKLPLPESSLVDSVSDVCKSDTIDWEAHTSTAPSSSPTNIGSDVTVTIKAVTIKGCENLMATRVWLTIIINDSDKS